MRSLITFCRHWMLSFSIFFISASVFVPVQALHAQPIILENDHLRVELSPLFPAVDRYVLKSNNQVIYGDVELPYAQIFYEGNFYDIDLAVDNIIQGGDRICYHMKGDLASQQVVTFDLCYILSGNSVELTFGNVQETPAYKLIVVRTPFLLTVRPDQGGAKLVFPYAEGRLIDVATTTSGHWEDCNTGGWTHAMLMAMLYHQGALAICSYDHLDMVMGWRVFDHPDKGRLGLIDIHFNYRHPPTNFELASFVDVFDEQTTSLSTKLTFLADYDQDGDIDWIDGAKFLRDQVHTMPESQYLSSWITKIGRNGLDNISQHLITIKKLYHLTDHNVIYSYLLDHWWWPFSIFGEDEDLNPGFATLEDLKLVFETAEKKYNTFLGFHDNYYDYYVGSPGYDPSLRVINQDGTPIPGYSPPGFPEAYYTDPYDYAMQVGLERVRKTLSRYPIKKSHHLDVFNLNIWRDYSLESPSSRERNRRGLKLIIDEFDKFGVDVTTEGITGPFVGSGIGWFLDTPRILETPPVFSSAEFIPLIEFIYHGKTLYGLFEDIYWGILPPEQVQIYTFLEPLLLGAGSASHITWSAPNDLELDKFYLIDLPWMALNQRFMEDYIADGSYRKITYDDDTFVEIDYDNNTYTVQVDGRVVGENYTTYYRKDENTFLIFSRNAKEISFTLPPEWFQSPNYVIKLFKLTEEGIAEGPPFQIGDLSITFNAEANTPYKLRLITGDVTLFTPNGGEIISSGSNCSILWGAPSGVAGFKLKYSLDNGNTWQLLAQDLTGNSYDWHVPTPLKTKNKCLVKVIGYSASGKKLGADRSDLPFTIEVLTVTSPNGGEIMTSGDLYSITWTTNGTKRPVEKVVLNYTKNDGRTWGKITAIEGSNPGTHSWTVPDVGKTKSKCKVKVVLKDAKGNTVASDSSDGYFTIEP